MSIKRKMLRALPFTDGELTQLIETAPLRYKEYFIPKRKPGEFRAIAQPSPEVKLLQRWLMANVLADFRVHECATAYRAGVGLLDNVRPHRPNRYLLKLDFNRFFPSIGSGDFAMYLARHGSFDSQDEHTLCRLLFKYNRRARSLELSIGAPSSPLISNIMLYEFDKAVSEFCEPGGIVYTRYADDMSFSTNTPDVLRSCKRYVEMVLRDLRYPALTLNEEKTIETSKKNGRHITGLVITGDNRVSIGRERKRVLRAQIRRFVLGELNADELGQLQGYLSFLKSVEPEHLERLKGSFGDDVIASLCRP
jgi:RNA-directed DNA polymerase